MPKSLVIVESPAKAKTIERFLGPDYVVESSVGHIRDLPVKASELPSAYKSESWAYLGVDVENDFKAHYVVTERSKKQVSKLKKLLKGVDELYLATDEDREGEAIGWHIADFLDLNQKETNRIVFNEFTKKAAENLRLTAQDCLNNKIIDSIIEEPPGGAHRFPKEQAKILEKKNNRDFR